MEEVIKNMRVVPKVNIQTDIKFDGKSDLKADDNSVKIVDKLIDGALVGLSIIGVTWLGTKIIDKFGK